MANTQIAKALGAVGVAFGVAGALIPDKLSAAYGDPPNPQADGALRLFGNRQLILGVMTLTADDDQVERLMQLTVAVCGLDIVSSALSLARHEGSPRTSVQVVLTSAAIGVAAYKSLKD